MIFFTATTATTVAVLICVVSTFVQFGPSYLALAVFPNCAMTFAFARLCELDILCKGVYFYLYILFTITIMEYN